MKLTALALVTLASFAIVEGELSEKLRSRVAQRLASKDTAATTALFWKGSKPSPAPKPTRRPTKYPTAKPTKFPTAPQTQPHSSCTEPRVRKEWNTQTAAEKTEYMRQLKVLMASGEYEKFVDTHYHVFGMAKAWRKQTWTEHCRISPVA